MDFRMQDRMDKMNNTASVMKQVVVLVGAGSIGQAIVRRVAAGKHDRATLVGRSKVTAAVFGGGRHTWPLKLHFTLLKENGRWLLASSTASTY